VTEDPHGVSPEVDEDVSVPVPRPHEPGEVEEILDELVEIVSSAKSMPLSSSAIIARDDVLDLLEEARSALPEEMRQARYMLRDHEELQRKAERDAEEIVKEAQLRAAQMVQRAEIVRQAEHRAQRILDEAETEARQMHHEADDYADQKLAYLEAVLDRLIRTARAGRERLAVLPFGPSADAGAEQDDELAPGDDLYDQDRP
jgi:hypothetical protein